MDEKTPLPRPQKRLLILLSGLLALSSMFSALLFAKYYALPRYHEYQAEHMPTRHTDYTRPLELSLRIFNAAGKENVWDTEKDSTYAHITKEIDLNKTALLIIDAWEDHGNDGWRERAKKNQKDSLLPLLELARENNMTVIHAPHGQKITSFLAPKSDELVLGYDNRLENTAEFDGYLAAHGITTLLYAGYALNWCMINRPVAMTQMNRLGYNTILVRDATVAMETPESLSGELVYYALVNIADSQLGGSTTVADIRHAFASSTY